MKQGLFEYDSVNLLSSLWLQPHQLCALSYLVNASTGHLFSCC